MKNELRIRVKIGDREVEISYPVTDRTSVTYENSATLVSAVKAIKDIVDKLMEE